jgi:hypothetical protein
MDTLFNEDGTRKGRARRWEGVRPETSKQIRCLLRSLPREGKGGTDVEVETDATGEGREGEPDGWPKEANVEKEELAQFAVGVVGGGPKADPNGEAGGEAGP